MSGLCDDIEKFGKGVGNASRYRIVEALFGGSRTVGEIVKKTKLSQSLVSQHLRVLKETGLVEDERQGQVVRYTLNNKHVISLLRRLTEELKPPKRK
jgi:DNA-binding transcriptional ArsR family regulator